MEWRKGRCSKMAYDEVTAWNELCNSTKEEESVFSEEENTWKFGREVSDDVNETGSLIQIIFYQI